MTHLSNLRALYERRPLCVESKYLLTAAGTCRFASGGDCSGMMARQSAASVLLIYRQTIRSHPTSRPTSRASADKALSPLITTAEKKENT